MSARHPATTELPSFDFHAAPALDTPVRITYGTGPSTIEGHVHVDCDGAVRFAVVAAPPSMSTDGACAALRGCFRGPKPLCCSTFPARAYKRIRDRIEAGDAYLAK